MKARVLPLIAAISAASLSMQTLAYGPIDGKVYGKMNVWVDSQDLENPDGRTTSVISDASRLGFKGESKLDGNTPLKDAKVIYQIEYEVAVDDGDTSKDNKDKQTISQRNVYIGLKGGAGELRVGNTDTPFKEAQGKVDQFNDLRGDLKNLFNGEIRQKNTVYYASPKIGDLSGAISYSAPENEDTENDAMSAALQLTMGDLYAALAYDNDASDSNNTIEAYRLVATYKLDALTLGAMWQKEHDSSYAKTTKYDASEDGMLLSAAYGLSDEITLKAQYATGDIKKAPGHDQISVGADYKLAKPTKLFAFHTQEDADGTDKGKAWTGIGIEHNF